MSDEKNKKHSFRDVDEFVYRIRKCAVENRDKCGIGFCKCERYKEDLMGLFNPTFYHLIETHAMYPCYSHRDDFEQEIKSRFLELIYEWDDQRGIYFVTYASIMLHRWVQKINNKLYDWTRRKAEDYKLFDIDHHDRTFDKEIDAMISNDKINKMMTHLTDKQKDAVQLRYVDNLMVNEISKKFDVSPGAVSNLLKRAYKILEEVEMIEGGKKIKGGKKKRKRKKYNVKST